MSRIPKRAKQLHRKLASSATGPGGIYLYKPLLHLLLPSWVSHLIVLDTDLFLFADIAQLWRASTLLPSNRIPPPPPVLALHPLAERCPYPVLSP